MTRIVVDHGTVQQFRTLTEPAQVCDEHGMVLGEFRPASDRTYADMEPEISEEELQRREQEPGRSLAEILADLQQRQ